MNVVIVDKHMLGKVHRKMPSMMDYQLHINNCSMLNTPPVFAIYVCLLTLRWVKNKGGITAMESLNKAKAELLYDTLDAHPLFRPSVAKEDRSRMNVVFRMDDPEKEKQFQEACKAANIVGVRPPIRWRISRFFIQRITDGKRHRTN